MLSEKTKLTLSISTIISVIGFVAGAVWWASQNVALAADLEKIVQGVNKQHLQMRLEIEHDANTDKIERYRRELIYQQNDQVKQGIMMDIQEAQQRNLNIENTLDKLEQSE